MIMFFIFFRLLSLVYTAGVLLLGFNLISKGIFGNMTTKEFFKGLVFILIWPLSACSVSGRVELNKVIGRL